MPRLSAQAHQIHPSVCWCVTASLALENAIKEAIEVGRLVYVVVLPGATRKRLEKLKLLDLLPEHHVSANRYEVLLHAVNQLPQLQELSS